MTAPIEDILRRIYGNRCPPRPPAHWVAVEICSTCGEGRPECGCERCGACLNCDDEAEDCRGGAAGE